MALHDEFREGEKFYHPSTSKVKFRGSRRYVTETIGSNLYQTLKDDKC